MTELISKRLVSDIDVYTHCGLSYYQGGSSALTKANPHYLMLVTKCL